MKKIIYNINGTIKKEKHIILFNIFIFLIGLILGTLFINIITKADKTLLIEQLDNYLINIDKLSSDVFGIKYFYDIILSNLLQLSLIFILGISMIGVLVVIFMLFFKGFMLGVTLSTFILKYKYKGILGIFLYIFPVNILNILIYIFISFFAVRSCIKFLNAFLKKGSLDFKQFLGKYILSFFISIILIIITSLFESYLTPLLLKLFTYII